MAAGLAKGHIRPFLSRFLPLTHAKCQGRRDYARLLEVGMFKDPKDPTTAYNKGQMFIHKVFGYRGIILFPWTTKVYDMNSAKKAVDGHRNSGSEHPLGTEWKVQGEDSYYYMAMVDKRDRLYRNDITEALMFSERYETDHFFKVIPETDFIPHDEVRPYISSEASPIHHDQFEKLFMLDSTDPAGLLGRPELKEFEEKIMPALQLSRVYVETTNDIKVTVIPFYRGYTRDTDNTNRHIWRYQIRIENLGNETVQLRERHWEILSVPGTLTSVKGRGVVGQEPKLSKNSPAFQYSSYLDLHSPHGKVWGIYKMARPDGSTFECNIPRFHLLSVKVDKTSNFGSTG